MPGFDTGNKDKLEILNQSPFLCNAIVLLHCTLVSYVIAIFESFQFTFFHQS